MHSWWLMPSKETGSPVAVMDYDGAVQVAVDKGLERGQGPLAQEVIGEQALAHATWRYFLFALGPGWCVAVSSSPQITRASRISTRIVVFAAATAPWRCGPAASAPTRRWAWSRPSTR